MVHATVGRTGHMDGLIGIDVTSSLCLSYGWLFTLRLRIWGAARVRGPL
jgi:hypothetical protein